MQVRPVELREEKSEVWECNARVMWGKQTVEAGAQSATPATATGASYRHQ